MIGGNTRAAMLDLIFLATAWADIAENDSSSPATQFDFSLHVADPTAAGNMSSNETSYPGYARQSVARSGSGFTRTGNSISPVADVEFPTGSGASSEVLSHFSVGKTGGGATDILFSGTLTPNLAVGTGVKPIILAASSITLT